MGSKPISHIFVVPSGLLSQKLYLFEFSVLELLEGDLVRPERKTLTGSLTVRPEPKHTTPCREIGEREKIYQLSSPREDGFLADDKKKYMGKNVQGWGQPKKERKIFLDF